MLFLFSRTIYKGAGYTSECSFADALYAFKRRGFGGEVGVVCSERLRAGYTSASPAPIPAFLAYLFTPCDDIHFPISHIAGPNHSDRFQGNCNFPPWRSILIAIAVGFRWHGDFLAFKHSAQSSVRRQVCSPPPRQRLGM